jgi:pimeloyl-ACP methyl ester carboxylesterase
MAAAAPSLSATRPWYHPLALLQRLVVYALIGYVTICVYLFSLQTSMIYVGANYPVATETALHEAKDAGLVPWDHPTPGAASPQGFVRPDFASPAPRGTIVCFHGNGEYAWESTAEVAAFTQRGYRVFLYEYPGYGGRKGVPSEKTIVPDARALVRSLAEAGYGPIYVWGRSLGAGVAAAVCADKTLPIQGLTLVAPWDNIANVGLSIYPYLPIRLLMFDKYDSIANLQEFKHPICVIRGDKDQTIIPPLSLNLFAHLSEPKKMMVMTGYGHGDWPNSPDLSWWDDALNFIAPPAPLPPGIPANINH